MPDPPDCSICSRLADLRAGRHPNLIAELETGYAVLADDQRRRGWTIFLCKVHASELHELEPAFRERFLLDMAVVAEAVYLALSPRKLNYEMLGNLDPHLHWHVFPRFSDDPMLTKPVWLIDPADLPETPAEVVGRMRSALRAEVEGLRGRAGSA